MNTSNNAMAWIIGIVAIAIVGGAVVLLMQNPPTEEENGATAGEEQTNNGTGRTPRIDRSGDSVVAIANDVSSASRFISLFNSTGVAAELNASGETYTVFVPTNGAFDLLAEGTLDNLSASELRRLVEHHVVVGRAVELNTIENSSIEAMSGDMLNFSVSDRDEIARVNSAIAFEAFVGENGMVYAINNVLLPPEE
ncbi:MAG: fasciclin domain-containing protein [bacterium]|nr:fasciclin domain-containing protein [bacterium]